MTAEPIVAGKNGSYHDAGMEAYRSGKFHEAEGLFRSAICSNPADLAPFMFLGIIKSKLGDVRGAIPYLRTAALIQPTQKEVLWNLAAAYSAVKEYHLAKQAIRAFLCIDPSCGPIFPFYTHTLTYLGEWDAARVISARTFSAGYASEPPQEKELIFHRQERFVTSMPKRRPFIFDCFIFFDELDVLEVRLEELNEYVDRFLLIEGRRTFSGKEKPLHYRSNAERYKKFWRKIIHVELDIYPPMKEHAPNTSVWDYEHLQRNMMNNALQYAHPDDIILMSDVDEIPRGTSIAALESVNEPSIFLQDNHQFFANWIVDNDPYWFGTRAVRAGGFTVDAQTVRDTYPKNVIHNGGWHFSSFGGVDAIIRKIESFAHQEFNLPQFKDKQNVIRRINSNNDVFCRGYKLREIDDESSLPEHMVRNRQKYPALFFDEQVTE